MNTEDKKGRKTHNGGSEDKDTEEKKGEHGGGNEHEEGEGHKKGEAFTNDMFCCVSYTWHSSRCC